MMEFREIYETMLGLLEPEAQVPGVENAFEEGGFCAAKYEDMRFSYENILNRLKVIGEDVDLNRIVDCMEYIQRELCERMYYLGREHGSLKG